MIAALGTTRRWFAHSSTRAVLIWIAVLLLGVYVGKTVASNMLLAFALLAACAVVLAAPFVERLAVLTFWVLPYMIVNLPTGVFTLKLPELVAYACAGGWLVRTMLRREPIAFPPAMVQVTLYLAALCISMVFASPIPLPYIGGFGPMDRNSPNIRPLSLIIWLGVGWLVVMMLYNTIGRDPQLFRKCLRAHILGGGVAAVISLLIYVVGASGVPLFNVGGGGTIRNLVPSSGSTLRLAGVAYEPLFLAFYLLTVLPVTLVAALNQPKWLPGKWLIAILFLELLVMLLTFSSGGWAGLAVATLFLLPVVRAQKVPPRVRRTLIILFSAASCIAVTVFVANESLILMLSGIAGKIFQGADVYRQSEWAVGRNISAAHPIFGCGPGLATFWFPKFSPTLVTTRLEGVLEVNNVPLNVVAETGAVGALTLGLCVICGLGRLLLALRRRGMANMPVLAALTASLIGVGVQYMSMNPLFLIYFSGLLGLATAAERLAMADTPVDAILEGGSTG